jgi:hypothetical protein
LLGTTAACVHNTVRALCTGQQYSSAASLITFCQKEFNMPPSAADVAHVLRGFVTSDSALELGLVPPERELEAEQDQQAANAGTTTMSGSRGSTAGSSEEFSVHSLLENISVITDIIIREMSSSIINNGSASTRADNNHDDGADGDDSRDSASDVLSVSLDEITSCGGPTLDGLSLAHPNDSARALTSALVTVLCKLGRLREAEKVIEILVEKGAQSAVSPPVVATLIHVSLSAVYCTYNCGISCNRNRLSYHPFHSPPFPTILFPTLPFPLISYHTGIFTGR